jgi:hypothetical protein
MVNETLIDLDDFDPLLQPISSLSNLQTLSDNDFNDVTTPTATEHSTTEEPNTIISPMPELSAEIHSTSYVLLDKTLRIVQQSGSGFDAEAKDLVNYTNSINETLNSKSLFLAPSVDYCTTKAESIKLIVYEDKT